MRRKTIDFGIDLGTTNSVIACMDQGKLVIIRNQLTNSEITPSAVKMDARGSVTVGQNAYNHLEEDPENTVGEFKRWMGNPGVDSFLFKKAGKRMTAAELSAEVLKVLKGSVGPRFDGEELTASVITVPAHFLIPSCEDTTRAAMLAGIDPCPFIQEPVAAAIAYGYQAESLTGNLLVIDLGGGTYDTSLLSARDGKLMVIGHDGDSKLGGKDYDWALVKVIVERIREQYGDLDLSQSNPAALLAMAKLKHKAEEAKKVLSVLEKAAVTVDGLGTMFDAVETVIELNRDDLKQATERLTARCLAISERLLQQSNVAVNGLANVLVVGGQTQTPYVRAAVRERFGKADCRLDPMTVVAAGAAIFAATERLPAKPKPASRTSKASLTIAYRPESSDLEADIGLAIDPVTPGSTVAVHRTDGGWTSGAIPVPESGNLFILVVLRAGQYNTFEVHLKDARGSRISVDDGSFSITQGVMTAPSTTSRPFAIALAGNRVETLIPKGSPLPAKGCLSLVTAHDVIAGNPKSILRTYVLEGANGRADRNIGIGTIELHGSDLIRSLPAGSEVEIRYALDVSRNLSAEAFFPDANETCVMMRMPTLPTLLPREIELELLKEKDRFDDLERAVPQGLDPEIGEQIMLIEQAAEAAANDNDARQNAALKLLEVKAALDASETLWEWELLVAEWNNYRGDTRKLAKLSGEEQKITDVEEIIGAGEDAIARRNLAQLRNSGRELKSAYWRMNCAREGYWKEELERLRKKTDFVDADKAERLKAEGTRAAMDDNDKLLHGAVRGLYALLPLMQQTELNDIYKDAGLTHMFSESVHR
jgi:molecular chaperone DnaK